MKPTAPPAKPASEKKQEPVKRPPGKDVARTVRDMQPDTRVRGGFKTR